MMSGPRRTPRIHHCTSEPLHFRGRADELALLDRAVAQDSVSLVAFIGPGGQGKTAIVQQWLIQGSQASSVNGVFLWSFYRSKDADSCLRGLYAYVADLAHPPEASASYCVDHLLPLLRRGRWVVVLDGTEVVQYESGPWFGRFLHPELGRLVEELASWPLPGVVVVTSRFPLPELERRPFVRQVYLGGLDPASARELLRSFGVHGSDDELDEAAAACGFHAKAVELLGTYLARFHEGSVAAVRVLPDAPLVEGMSDEEHKVGRVLAAHQAALDQETHDILCLATAFRDPPTEGRLLEYLSSEPVRRLLAETWGRRYPSFQERGREWVSARLQELVDLRLLERVGLDLTKTQRSADAVFIDAHPLVRRAFAHALGGAGRRESAGARAGFLRGRPDRRRPASLEAAREEVELFHAYCDAGLWDEADRVVEALDKPRYRFLAPAFERDLLLRFFPDGNWRRPPLWSGFKRFRSLAICLEMLGSFADAVAAYGEEDAPLRGDALIALGRLGPLLVDTRPPHPWEMLWQSYRAHALCLAGRTDEALRLAGTLVPVDVYEWTHVFECLLRTGKLTALDMRSFLYRPPRADEHRWNELARQRMRADYLRVTGTGQAAELGTIYEEILEAYDRGGLPYERALTRLGYSRWLLTMDRLEAATEVIAATLDLAQRHGMRVTEADALHLETALFQCGGRLRESATAEQLAIRIRQEIVYHGLTRP